MPSVDEWVGERDVGTEKSNDGINRLSFCTLAYVSECARVIVDADFASGSRKKDI